VSPALNLVSMDDDGRLSTGVFVIPALGFACTLSCMTACGVRGDEDWSTPSADSVAKDAELTNAELAREHCREATAKKARNRS
jgi:hypothetical protein